MQLADKAGADNSDANLSGDWSGHQRLSPLPVRERMKVRVRIQRLARFTILPLSQHARYSFKSLSRRSFSSSRSRLYLVGSSIVFDGGAIGLRIFAIKPPGRCFFGLR